MMEMRFSSAWKQHQSCLALLAVCVVIALNTYDGIAMNPSFLEVDKKDPFAGTTPDYIHFGKDALFYWLVPASFAAEDKPLILWLTGGPGCSSLFAAIKENGPFDIDSDGNVVTRHLSWTILGNMLYIDQPFGTGFSVGVDRKIRVTDEEEVSKYLYEFLLKFMEKHPEFRERPLYITGESYGGHYVPHFGAYLAQKKTKELNFQGIAVGNGWIQPFLQYSQYTSYAYVHGFSDKDKLTSATGVLSKCISDLKSKNPNEYLTCTEGIDLVIGNRNPYNYKETCKSFPCGLDSKPMETFLNRKDIQEQLGVNKHFEACNVSVFDNFEMDWNTGMNPSIDYLLRNDYPVILYYGDLDIICNWYGGRAIAESVMANIYPDVTPKFEDFTIREEIFGQIMENKKFAFIRVFDASHMVPTDQPVAALGVLEKLLSYEKVRREVRFSAKEF